MDTFLGIFIPMLAVGGPLLFAYYIGRTVETRHMRRLDEQERQFAHILVLNLRSIPPLRPIEETALVAGEAVIASDYFKTFAAGLRNTVGGEVRSLETLMVRARRQAVLRMLEQARAMGAQAVFNIRYETAYIGFKNDARTSVPIAEILAYGTAVRYADAA